MGRVKRHPALLLAILLYVSLDLSLSMMPGAFQFDPAESVESLQGSRARAVPIREVAPPAAPAAALVPRPVDITHYRIPTRPADSRWRLAISASSRISSEPAAPSEEPH